MSRDGPRFNVTVPDLTTSPAPAVLELELELDELEDE